MVVCRRTISWCLLLGDMGDVWDLGNGECKPCSNLRFDAGYMELVTLLAPPESRRSGIGFLCEASRWEEDPETEE